MRACIILHNMIVEDERNTYATPFGPLPSYDDISDGLSQPNLGEEPFAPYENYIQSNIRIRDKPKHRQLQADLVEHISQRYIRCKIHFDLMGPSCKWKWACALEENDHIFINNNRPGNTIHSEDEIIPRIVGSRIVGSRAATLLRLRRDAEVGVSDSRMIENKNKFRFGSVNRSNSKCKPKPNRNKSVREKDRERAAARGGGNNKKDDGLTPEQRRERDAKALQEKNAKKAAQAAGGDAGGKTSKK
ncbi:hypothetical protein QQ045_018704 [Rhodiola kirilowii]